MCRIWIFLVFCLASLLASAQSSKVEVSYELCEDDMIRELMDFQEIRYYKVFVKGDFSGKMCNLVMVHCRDGKFSYDNKPVRFQEKDSVIQLTYFAQSVDADTSKISLKSKAIHSTSKYDVKNCKSHILMETYTETPLTTADTIPVIAYTTGLVQSFMFEGKPVTGIDYCGLRFAKINPEKWPEKYGVKDFVYYIIYFEPFDTGKE
ncbi:hypothetical protein [Parabacteroides faecis]|uniref:hypothetical protein n=1 Tax=Parabacteroides faecis TaxID=1217282 RepID=UPI0035204F11